MSGIDLTGHEFVEPARTEFVNSDGASILIRRTLGPGQEIVIRRVGYKQDAAARVIGQVGIQTEGHVYGIALLNPNISFWGIHFPPRSEADKALVRILLACCACRTRQVSNLDEFEFEIFEANQRISRPCAKCGGLTIWKLVEAGETSVEESKEAPSESAAPDAHVPLPSRDRRRQPRTRMRLAACLRQPLGVEEVVTVVDISRGGVRFRTPKQYPVEQWVEIAVPFTRGGANIFVPGRIVWEKNINDNLKEYGIQYVK
ncbi:MAG TPA: PilZ domain-containing protein [Terriglobales bacterium]|nr:PilZ domain-containing protein [Terriglobales bacterium]